MIDLVPFADLDPAAVEQNRAEAVRRVRDDNPRLDLRRGVLADLVAFYHAVLSAQQQRNVDDYLRARSLAALAADPAAADPDLVDAVLSNYRVTRRPPTAAAGTVTVVVADDVTVTLARGAVFRGGGGAFVTPAVFTAKAEAAQVAGPNDRLLVRTADGHWAFTVDVVAPVAGGGGLVTAGGLVAPDNPPPGYVTSYAAADFTPGTAAETNAELLQRLQEGLAARGLGGRVAMAATLHAEPAFAAVPALSVVGMGDPEMSRDRHSILPVSLGGRVDWYVRTAGRAARTTLTAAAALVEKRADGRGVWQLALDRDAAPGFYEIAAVRPVGAAALGGFPLLAEVRSADLSGPAFVPDVDPDWPAEWAYSRYQAAVVRFLDTETDVAALAVGARADYAVDVVGLPLVGAIQDWACDPAMRPRAYDLLVKAAVPCFVSASFTVYKPAADPAPDLDGVREAACAVVNGTGFVGRLYASSLYEAITNRLPAGTTVSRLDLVGRLRYPDGSTAYLRGDELLEVPDDPAGGVTPRTVQFYMNPDDVGVTVAAAAATDV